MIADIVRGTLTIVIIMLVSGVIAYVGDRVGHQVGRKRLTLFGIRPRYTSTIVAVGTGMFIALVAMLVAILWSQQVKTALFRMNQISEQITQLQTREKDLERKVQSGQLVVPVDTLLVPFFAIVPKGSAVDQRLTKISDFYKQAVVYMNGTYVPYGLKKFVAPTDLEKRLRDTYGAPEVSAASLDSNLLIFITADQNLYSGDELHFEMNLIADVRRLAKGDVIGSLTIPGGKNADINLAVGELQGLISNAAQKSLRLPAFLARTVRVVQSYPSPAQMQSMLSKPGRYVLSAYAAEDIYPHTGGIPIVVTLTQAK